MTMTFDDWLEHVGLGHCRQPLLDNGIDFDVAFDLTLDALVRCGLTVGDSLRLLKALNAIRTDAGAAPAILDPPPEPRRAVTGERRQLTVMFCDLVGYTELTQRYDGELLNRMIAVEDCDSIGAMSFQISFHTTDVGWPSARGCLPPMIDL